jgi:hypothetical protein
MIDLNEAHPATLSNMPATFPAGHKPIQQQHLPTSSVAADSASWAHGQPDISGSSCLPASLSDVIDAIARHHQWHRPVQ